MTTVLAGAQVSPSGDVGPTGPSQVLFVYAESVRSTGTGEYYPAGYSYVMPANTLGKNGDMVKVSCACADAVAAGSKGKKFRLNGIVELNFGGSTSTLYSIYLEVYMQRYSNANIIRYTQNTIMYDGTNALSFTQNISSSSQNFASPITISVSGSAAAGVIDWYTLRVELFPAP